MSPHHTTLLGLGESWNGGRGGRIPGTEGVGALGRGSASLLSPDSSPGDSGALGGKSGPPRPLGSAPFSSGPDLSLTTEDSVLEVGTRCGDEFRL